MPVVARRVRKTTTSGVPSEITFYHITGVHSSKFIFLLVPLVKVSETMITTTSRNTAIRTRSMRPEEVHYLPDLAVYINLSL